MFLENLDMGVNFFVDGHRHMITNISKPYANQILTMLGLNSGELYGDVRGRDLHVRCLRTLEYLNKHAPTTENRLTFYVTKLLELATYAGDLGVIVWEF